MKRVIGIVIIFVTLCIACNYALASDTRTSGLYTYSIKGNGTITITAFDWENNDGDVYIPTMIDGYSVTGIGNRAFADNRTGQKETVSVNIPNSITSIGDFAFEGANIVYANIPKSISIIGINPFCRCVMLKQIAVDPQNEKYASVDGALYEKAKKMLISYPISLSAAIPKGITTIGDYACVGVTWDAFRDEGYFTKESTITTIGNYAFCDATITEGGSLMPDSVESVGEYAYYQVTIMAKNGIRHNRPEEINPSMDWQYGGVNSWEYFSILGKNVKKLGRGAFQLAEIYCAQQKDVSGITINVSPDILFVVLGWDEGKSAPIQVIPADAFRNMVVHDAGAIIYIKANLDSIESHAFDGIANNILVSMDYTSIKEVKEYAFYQSHVVGIMYVDQCEPHGFQGMKRRDKIPEIQWKGTEIPAHAFEDAECRIRLKTNELQTIDEYAFCNSGFIAIYLADELQKISIKTIGAHAFDNAGGSSFLLPDVLEKIGEGAFINNPNLHEISIPNSVETIGDNAFDKDNIKLVVYRDSYGEFWAQENGYSYHYEGEDGENIDWLNN